MSSEPRRLLLPEHCGKRIVVLCCGNVLFGDDGFGPAVAQRVQREARIPDDVAVIDAGSSVRELLFDLVIAPPRPERVVLVDAVDLNREAGTILEIDLETLPAGEASGFSSHHPPTGALLRRLRDETGVDVVILTCQVRSFPEQVEEGLSPPVAAAVPRMATMIIERFLRPDPSAARGPSAP
jgi:coenzyme F420 hydrogenase subunit delta